MTELQRAKNFAAKRAQAERNVARRIDAILNETAQQILQQSQGLVIVSSKALFSELMAVRTHPAIEAAKTQINGLIRDYAKASITTLEDKNTGATTRLLNSNLFGRTFEQRTETYMRYFLGDVLNLIMAGRRLRLSNARLADAVSKEWRDPYNGTLITQANRKGANITTPSYGRGIYHSAYDNIIRAAQGTIAIAWGREERNFARRNGATGFYVHRGSTFPCDLCQSKVGFLHPITDPVTPFHVRCKCFIEYVFN